MSFKRLLLVMLLMLPAVGAGAQFYVAGDEPARVRWSRTDTRNFMLIYPRGLDSLAREYGRELETWRTPVGRSIHYLPGEHTRGKIPVVLHPFNSYANGSVAWAPRRMDLYTIPDAYTFTPMRWERMLAIHESRHVAQMQLGLTGSLRPFNWFFGEMANGAFAGIYGHFSWKEGDAVIAETALTGTGRGRTADFLNYYRIAFDQGQMRSLDRWARDSFTKYHPDKYALGYLMLAGFRWYYDDPDFLGASYENCSKKAWNVLNHWRVRQHSGLWLRDAFKTVADSIAVTWREEIQERGPFMPMEQVTGMPRRGYMRFSGLAFAGGELHAVRSSMYRSPELVKIDTSGRVRRLKAAASYSSTLKADGDTLWWSETVSGPRWSLYNRSSLRFSKGDHRAAASATHKGHLYNPSPSPGENLVAAAEYLEGGRTRLVLFDKGGQRLASHEVPDSLQIVESAWAGGTVYASCIGNSGAGIFRLDCDSLLLSGAPCSWTAVLGCSPVMISGLGISPAGRLMFTSDRTGSNELYELDLESGLVLQMTSIRYGAKHYQYSPDGKWLYYAAGQLDGVPVCRTATDSLPSRVVDFGRRHEYFLAECLSRQERLLEQTRDEESLPPTCPDSVWFSEPRRYGKILHGFNVHSWAPVYFNYDNIRSMSFDRFYEAASPGVAFLSQNRLGTLVASGGYSAHPDPDGGRWRHSAHANVTYTGLYPVIEASVDFNDRAARNFMPVKYDRVGSMAAISMNVQKAARPYVAGKVSVYIPWKWSKGGLLSGFIPKVSYTVSNDAYSTGYAGWYRSMTPAEDGTLHLRGLDGVSRGKIIPAQTISASLRAYLMTGKAERAAYPRAGIGFEAGLIEHLGLHIAKFKRDFYRPVAYGYIYGYLPGFLPEQGWRLTAKYQRSLQDKGLFWSGALNALPRGMQKNATLAMQACTAQKQVLGLSAEYGIPFSIGDPSIAHGLLFIGGMTLTPHFDMTFNSAGSLLSTGATLTAEVSSFLWITVPFDIGVTYSWNGGSAFSRYEKGGIPIGRHFVGLVGSINF